MKKVTLGILGMIALISCSDKNTDLLKENLKTKVRLSDSEIESTQFKTTKMLASDGKKALITLSLNRKYIVAKEGGLYASALDVCKDSEIKDDTEVFYIEAYRIAKDSVFKKIYFTNENKIVGEFLLK